MVEEGKVGSWQLAVGRDWRFEIGDFRGSVAAGPEAPPYLAGLALEFAEAEAFDAGAAVEVGGGGAGGGAAAAHGGAAPFAEGGGGETDLLLVVPER
jgi:hypothetical protein